MPTHPGRDGRLAGGLARLLCLLWLAGVAMRMTLLVMPPGGRCDNRNLALATPMAGAFLRGGHDSG
jgi:hypothetical protein